MNKPIYSQLAELVYAARQPHYVQDDMHDDAESLVDRTPSVRTRRCHHRLTGTSTRRRREFRYASTARQS